MNVLGASVREDTVTFAVWAPRCRSVDVAIEGRRPQPMTRGADDVFTLPVANIAPGTRYKYRLDGERYRPDPTARWQPEGVHGASAVVDAQRFVWTDEDFRGHAPGDLVVYELHVGTFTAAGTFGAIIQHLPAPVDLGGTAGQLMPVAEFPGSRNWGYDGVHLYAPPSTYGGPLGLRRLVDACHAAGLSVLLDVVYNHLGPEVIVDDVEEDRRSEEHTSELQSRLHLVCRLLLEKKKKETQVVYERMHGFTDCATLALRTGC